MASAVWKYARVTLLGAGLLLGILWIGAGIWHAVTASEASFLRSSLKIIAGIGVVFWIADALFPSESES